MIIQYELKCGEGFDFTCDSLEDVTEILDTFPIHDFTLTVEKIHTIHDYETYKTIRMVKK